MIEIKKIRKNFGDKEILKDISLSLNKGRVYGLLGNNGVGKTTLTKIIFQEYSYNQGEIVVDNQPITKTDFKDWYFFTENNELPKNMTVACYIEMVSLMSKISPFDQVYRMKKINYFLNIEALMKQKIGTLSAGQQKILSLFVCFLVRPKVIFFDEPTANLDIRNKDIIMGAIKKLHDEETLIVIITHLIDEVKDVLTDVIIMDDGEIKLSRPFSKTEDIRSLFRSNTTSLANNDQKIQEYLDASNNKN